MEKQSCDGLRKEYKHSCYDQSPYSENTKGDPVSMSDTVMFFCTVVLSCKSIQGRSKTVRSIRVSTMEIMQ